MYVFYLSRYGICTFLSPDLLKAEIQLPKTIRDLLMLLASVNALPELLVFLTISEPAKSTKFTFPCLVIYKVSPLSPIEIKRQNN